MKVEISPENCRSYITIEVRPMIERDIVAMYGNALAVQSLYLVSEYLKAVPQHNVLQLPYFCHLVFYRAKFSPYIRE